MKKTDKDPAAMPESLDFQAVLEHLPAVAALCDAAEMLEKARIDCMAEYPAIHGLVDCLLDGINAVNPCHALAEIIYYRARLHVTPIPCNVAENIRLAVLPHTSTPLQDIVQAYFAARRFLFFAQAPELYIFTPYVPKGKGMHRLDDEEKEHARALLDTAEKITLQFIAAWQDQEKKGQARILRDGACRKAAQKLAEYCLKNNDFPPLAARLQARAKDKKPHEIRCVEYRAQAAAAMACFSPCLASLQMAYCHSQLQAALDKMTDKATPLEYGFMPMPANVQTSGERLRFFMLAENYPYDAAALIGYAIDTINANKAKRKA